MNNIEGFEGELTARRYLKAWLEGRIVELQHIDDEAVARRDPKIRAGGIVVIVVSRKERRLRTSRHVLLIQLITCIEIAFKYNSGIDIMSFF